ncbi:PREDICTED: protein lethal(2)essential for life-like [Nicrophorus vespilloides]|uniref:Protein lethal(2)essential for life-like n=1 Tax=Nicrophorus vespilloides TaxID=110193 RepID=A0ABM1NCG9_NICVS|nr:PREDICTED: protein lethal(2)essential for life-like [Nicrophorus vespilloides]
MSAAQAFWQAKMSLPPVVCRGWPRSSRILDQHFGVTLDVTDSFIPIAAPEEFWRMLGRRRFFRLWKTLASTGDRGSTVIMDVYKFLVNLDVQQFMPDEITVKATGNNVITVEAKHEQRKDRHGLVFRHFVRKYFVPQGYNIEGILSELSSDGMLSIVIPREEEYNQAPIFKFGKLAIKDK